jgi:hypothetical protein
MKKKYRIKIFNKLVYRKFKFNKLKKKKKKSNLKKISVQKENNSSCRLSTSPNIAQGIENEPLLSLE